MNQFYTAFSHHERAATYLSTALHTPGPLPPASAAASSLHRGQPHVKPYPNCSALLRCCRPMPVSTYEMVSCSWAEMSRAATNETTALFSGNVTSRFGSQLHVVGKRGANDWSLLRSCDAVATHQLQATRVALPWARGPRFFL